MQSPIRSPNSLLVVARLLGGESTEADEQRLTEALRDPFRRRLDSAVYEKPLTDAPEAQAKIDAQGEMLRAHDEAYAPR